MGDAGGWTGVGSRSCHTPTAIPPSTATPAITIRLRDILIYERAASFPLSFSLILSIRHVVFRRNFRMTIRVLALVFMMAAASVPSAWAQAATQEAPSRRPDVIYVPTPEEVVEAMLQ